VDFSSSPTLSHSSSIILLQVVHLRHEKNDLVVVYGSIFYSHGVGTWWGMGMRGKKRIVVILIVTHYMKMRKVWKG
jgi:hypothetical protein